MVSLVVRLVEIWAQGCGNRHPIGAGLLLPLTFLFEHELRDIDRDQARRLFRDHVQGMTPDEKRCSVYVGFLVAKILRKPWGSSHGNPNSVAKYHGAIHRQVFGATRSDHVRPCQSRSRALLSDPGPVDPSTVNPTRTP